MSGASRTISCCSPPNEQDARPRRPRRGQRHLPRDARAPVRDARRDPGGGKRRDRRRGGGSLLIALAGRGADGLPHAWAERGRGDACGPDRLPVYPCRLSERVGDAAGDRRGARRGRGRLRDEGRGLRQPRRDGARGGGVKLTNENTAVVLDSTADFPEAPERFPNFRVVPLYVRFGDESFRDYVKIDPARFYERLQSEAALPTTSQPTPGDFLATFEELSASYDTILSLQISSTLSGTYGSAVTAAETLGNGKVRVIDSRTVAASIAVLAIGMQRR